MQASLYIANIHVQKCDNKCTSITIISSNKIYVNCYAHGLDYHMSTCTHNTHDYIM